jgi:DNA polymerase-3 subunit epsilon
MDGLGVLGPADFDIAVVDVETTGFAAQHADRIIEIAIVRLSARGELLDEFETLVNPHRDVGPSHVHGIRACDVRDAPTFAEVAGDIALRLQGAVFVAHNASFDRRFVIAEFGRLGHVVSPSPHLCTMHLAGVAGLSGRRLDICCEECGVMLADHHSALCDARATANLFQTLLSRRGMSLSEALVSFHETPPQPLPWPALPVGARRLTRRESATLWETPSTYVADLVRRVSAAGLGGAVETSAYTELLDRVLEDRQVTRAEVEGLADLALLLDMTAVQVVQSHQNYLEALASVAWSDGLLTESEAADLRRVGALLGLDGETARSTVEGCAGGFSGACLPLPSLAGESVCFTGQLQREVEGLPMERGEAERLAQGAGLLVKSGVSKKLDILVCADPDSQSAKARKARQYGVRIMAEEAFWRAIEG